MPSNINSSESFELSEMARLKFTNADIGLSWCKMLLLHFQTNKSEIGIALPLKRIEIDRLCEAGISCYELLLFEEAHARVVPKGG